MRLSAMLADRLCHNLGSRLSSANTEHPAWKYAIQEIDATCWKSTDGRSPNPCAATASRCRTGMPARLGTTPCSITGPAENNGLSILPIRRGPAKSGCWTPPRRRPDRTPAATFTADKRFAASNVGPARHPPAALYENVPALRRQSHGAAASDLLKQKASLQRDHVAIELVRTSRNTG